MPEMPIDITYHSDWSAELIKCPSQCFRPFMVGKQGTYGFWGVLYLRWRGGDPWQMRIIPARDEHYFWVDFDDVPFFTHDAYLHAQVWFQQFFEEHTALCIDRCIDSWIDRARDERDRWNKSKGSL